MIQVLIVIAIVSIIPIGVIFGPIALEWADLRCEKMRDKAARNRRLT